MSADERRDQVVRAAVSEFAIRGLEGTSTGDIAKRVGVSQPYLFRLFPTKRDLFIAAVDYSCGQVRKVFSEAAEGKYGVEALAAMGEAYQDLLLADNELLGMQLQQFAACHDPDVQTAVRHGMQGIWQHVDNLSGAPVEVRVDFFAKGMLCNMIAAMGRATGSDPMWQPILDVLRDDVTLPDAETDGAPAAGPDAETESGPEAEPAADGTAESAGSCVIDSEPPRPGSPREASYAAYVARSFSP